MKRQIIEIDEELCNGCGECCQGCPEGALQMIDGKARLVSDITCDGLGACVGTCPVGAITVIEREAEPYDERKTLDNILPMGTNTLKAHLKHLHEHGQTTFLNQAIAYLQELRMSVPNFREGSACGCHGHESASPAPAPQAAAAPTPGQGHAHQGCPGSAARTLERPAAGPVSSEAVPSQLTQWPVQLHLLSPMNPAFRGADLLLAADCVAFALGDFHQRHLAGKKLAIACPKLDQGQEIYLDKLTALIDEAQINTLTVMIMEVPCCGGLLRMAQAAAQRASRKVPIKAVVVGVDGSLKQEGWV